MDYTIVDGGVAVISVVSGMLAYARGLTREMFAIFGWVLAGAAAFLLAPIVEPIVREAPVVGPFLATSCVISMIVSFTLVVALVLLVLSVFTPLVSNVVLSSILGPIDRVLGFVFGVVRGLALVAVAYILYLNLSGGAEWPPLENAASKVIFEEAAAMIEANLPDTVPTWFGERIDALMAPCGAELPGVNGGGDPAGTGNGADEGSDT